MSQSRKEFIVGILLAIFLWIFGPEIIPKIHEPYIRSIAGIIIILLVIWVLIGDQVVNWYNNTSNERKQKKVKSLQSELIKIQAAQAYFQANPDEFVKSVTLDIFRVLVNLCLGFLLVNASSIFEAIGLIPFSIVALPSFLEALIGARRAFWFYKRILFIPIFKEETEAKIRELNSTSQRGNLKITKAFYCVKNTEIKIDVTSQIYNKLTNNKIDYVVGDDLLLFDPAPGLEKELSIKYTENRQKKEIVASLGERLIIP
jgi:hypothetical protein